MSEITETSEARIALLEPLWRDGLTVTDIIQRTGLTRNQVGWLVRQNPDRLPPRRRGFSAATHPAKLRALRAARDGRSGQAKPLAGKDSSAPPLSFGSASLAGTPGDPPAKAEAFRPLPGTHPVPLWADEATGCRWPVHVDGSDPMSHATLFVCNEVLGPPPAPSGARELKGGANYCATHAALANGEGPWAERRALRDARRAA